MATRYFTATSLDGYILLPRRIVADRMRLVDVERMGQFAELVYRLS
ncbi:hypothetical protein ACFVAV_03000 [Nocardia sp. NPDC057663]